MLNYVSERVWAVKIPPVVFQCRLQKLEFLQWHPSVGRIQLSFSSGIPVWGLFQLSFSSGVPVYPASIRWVAQVSQCTLGQPVAFQCTLDQPVYTGSGCIESILWLARCRSRNSEGYG